MKKESHLHIDVTVPFVWNVRQNVLEAPGWLQTLIYPNGSAEGNPVAAFLEGVKAPSDVWVNIHVAIQPID